MIPRKNSVLCSLVLVWAVCVESRRVVATPRNVHARTPHNTGGGSTVDLVTKWKMPYNPVSGVMSGKLQEMKPVSTVEIPRVFDDDNAVDDEDYDSNDVSLGKQSDSPIWDENFGSGSGEEMMISTTTTTRRPMQHTTRFSLPSYPPIKPTTAAPTSPTMATPPPIKVPSPSTSCGPNDVLCDAIEHSDDDVFGIKQDDWIEGDENNLNDDDIFGKKNASWTWGKYPESSIHSGVAVAVEQTMMLTTDEELRLKESVVQALRPLTLSPCATKRGENAKCKVLNDIIRDLTMVGLLFTSERSNRH